MGPLDALWHLLNLLAVPLATGGLCTLFTKLIWRSALSALRWQRLLVWAVSSSTAAWLSGLVYFGRDGKMASYALMVVCCALSLWWAGFAAKR